MSSDILEGFVSIFQGVEAKKAADEAARDEKKQAAIITRESEAEADRREKQLIKFRKKQKLQLLKSGITLEDTPLLILEETAEESKKEVESIRRGGRAEAAFRRKKSKRFRRRGRAALISGTLAGFASFARSEEKGSGGTGTKASKGTGKEAAK